MKTGKAVKISPEQFAPLEEVWTKVVRQTRLWLWKLDASLPGKLGKFGDWLNQAEEILEQEEDLLENPEEMAAQLGNILQEHKVYILECCTDYGVKYDRVLHAVFITNLQVGSGCLMLCITVLKEMSILLTFKVKVIF